MNGPQLKSLRESLGLTQKELAVRLGISERQVSKKENNWVKISQTDVLALRQIALEMGQETRF